MASRFLLMLTSFLSLAAVLVFYIGVRKKEPNESKLLEESSRKDDIGFHSVEITPIPRQRLPNGELYHE